MSKIYNYETLIKANTSLQQCLLKPTEDKCLKEKDYLIAELQSTFPVLNDSRHEYLRCLSSSRKWRREYLQCLKSSRRWRKNKQRCENKYF